TVFASGFLTPSVNNNGAAFGLFAALANGTVVELPVYVAPTAKVQVIHNCASPLAASVDVYVNGALTLDNFAFRTATPFVELPAGVPVSIAIAGPTSTSVADALATFNYYSLQRDENYSIIASGVVGTGFAANPNGLDITFDLKALGAAQTAGTGANVDFNVFHGATDAPGVDVRLSNGGALLVNNLKYGNGTGYLSVPAASYLIDLLVEDSSAVVNTYIADLSTLSGGAATVFASGFLTPSANNNGAAFGLFAALASGTVVELPVYVAPTAKVQVLHNCADPLAASVDVYINGDLAIDNFAFRTATPFISLPAGVPVSIAIAGPTSTSVADALATFNYDSLQRNENYIITASGVVGTGFAVNPDGVSTGFQLLINTPAREQATSGSNVDFFVIHGSTDAPTVDVKVMGGSTIVDNASYTDQTPYLSVPAASYVLEVQDETGAATLKRYVADLSTLGGGSGTILASGFLVPSLNNNGPAFGVYLVTAAGGAFTALPEYQPSSINDLAKAINFNMLPNPTSGNVTFTFNVSEPTATTIDVVNMNGQIVSQVLDGTVSGKQKITANLNGLAKGIYFVRVTNGEQTANSKLVIE
ncbi:MAG: DUF4397 domain-containing protein, partial [Bacteroidetes bacterium]|nr:DUF4397 domain-containing protein [Bacteroidota bacterium]